VDFGAGELRKHGAKLKLVGQPLEIPEALKEARLVRLPEANPLDVATATTAIAAAGQRAEAEASLRRLLQLGKQRWVCPYELGTTYLALGDKEQALHELENAYQAAFDLHDLGQG
jgi:predicted Zn-dependent protease